MIEDASSSPDPDCQRATRTIVVVDMVESVRLMQQHEMDVIARWRRFVQHVRLDILPKYQGRLVKSLGDGMLLDFEVTRNACAAALAIQGCIGRFNLDTTPDNEMLLRIGAHVACVVIDDLDIYGAGVNITARLASLASAGQIVVSEEFGDGLIPNVDATLEDMGPCWLKHVTNPVRAFQLSATGQLTIISPFDTRKSFITEAMVPTVAVLPFGVNGDGSPLLGEMVADSAISQLSLAPDLRVISRLSTTRLRDRHCSLEEVATLTNATYVLSGQCWIRGATASVHVELADTRVGTVEWADHVTCTVASLFTEHAAAIDRVTQGAHAAILQTEARRATHRPLPNLEGYSLLLGGIGLLHRSGPADFQRAHDTLLTLSERVPAHAASYAWRAKWHFLRIIRGQSDHLKRDRQEAAHCVDQALERDPDSAIAWTVKGLVQGFLDKQLDNAETSYAKALETNPNETLAWLYSATLRSWRGDGSGAVAAAERALRLSPLDPMRYYFESLAAAAYLCDGQYDTAIALCDRSLKLNLGHTPTYRVRAIAQMLAGQGDAARQTVQLMLGLEPDLTVDHYLARYPGGDVPHARIYADALRAAGLPA